MEGVKINNLDHEGARSVQLTHKQNKGTEELAKTHAEAAMTA